MNQPIKVLGLSFAFDRTELFKGATRTFVRCPLCSRAMLAETAHDHVVKHQARDAKASAKDALRELGATAKPLPGQLGLDMGGGRSSSRTSIGARK